MIPITRPHSISVDLTDGQMHSLEAIIKALHRKSPESSVDDLINSLVGCAIGDAFEDLCRAAIPCQAS